MREAIPRHVWVDVTGAWGHHSGPGILLMWQKNHRDEWEAWVIYASTYSTGHGLKSRVTQSWVNAAHIREADDRPPTS